MKGRETKMLTARQFANRHGVPHSTVIFWLNKGVIPGAEKLEIAVGGKGFLWRIPDDAQLPKLPKGPKPKQKASKKIAKKGRPKK
jgi:hypothetical protein